MNKYLLLGSLSLVLAACSSTETKEPTKPVGAATTFTVRMENVSTASTLPTPGGKSASVAIPLSPVVWSVHTGVNPIWILNEKASAGLQAVAEDGEAATLAAEIKPNSISSGVANTPVGATAPDAILPGGAYSFEISAKPGDLFSFATMFVQSNDLFYDFPGAGLNLFGTDGTPISGDLTSQVVLFDAGTEVNEQPGVGDNQKPRQAADNQGPDENGLVVRVSANNDGFTYPAANNVIQVTITPK